MVLLSRIYTRGGDKGRTSLGNGKRVAKNDRRVAAYGAIDEANAALGLALLAIGKSRAKRKAGLADRDLRAMMLRIQNDLFDLGADLCRPEEKGGTEKSGASPLRISPAQTTRLEREIDLMNAELSPLRSFVLPGGSPAAAALHLARTILRRAERDVIALAARERVNPAAIAYVNRLSDHLFVMARYLNDRGRKDSLWVPGAHR